jgi:hypothetical protein
VCAASAQLPRVGDINFYGLHKMTPGEILAAARLGPGDQLPASRIDLEDRIVGLPDVMDAHVQSLCCEGDRTTLFIGVQERGEAEVEFRVPPSGTATLPDELMTRYRKYSGALSRAELNGGGAADAALRRDREYFRAYATSHILKLRTELRTGSDAEQRAAAITAIACSSSKTALNDLLYALQDPDDGVRSNAIRELAAIAVIDIRIPPAGLVDLLNSVVLSDRVQATKALLKLTEKQNAAALDAIRERALPSLAEMARWQTRSYALPPFQLIGRVAGLKDAEVNESWEHGDPEAVIQQALDSTAKKPGLQ